MWLLWTLLGLLLLVIAVAVHDLLQTKHPVPRNFPVVGHFRSMLVELGPKLRQYIVAGNNEERPFTRDEREWIFESSAGRSNYFGFGTDNELETAPNYLVFKHAAFPLSELQPEIDGSDPLFPIPCAKVLGGPRDRARKFRPNSVVNVSAMSFGSLSGPAIEAINRGCAKIGSLHNTGEGGVSKYHQHGGDLIWQIGTGYFGCRASDGGFDFGRFKETVAAHDEIKAIELKLSQGAKPGLGGVLPKSKITPEIAHIRGIPRDRDCISPPSHSAFGSVDELLDFVEKLAEGTGRPIGIKAAIGESAFWSELAEKMAPGNRGVDFITIDGGEGGTGAGPLVFTDHVALPFKLGFVRVYRKFFDRGLHERVAFIGSGKLGLPESALLAFALGCDLVNVAREAMLSVGCIQAQKCQTGKCPTGVATQSRRYTRGLHAPTQALAFANYVKTLRKEILWVTRACGAEHPALLGPDHAEILDGHFGTSDIRRTFGFDDERYERWGQPSDEDCEWVRVRMRELAGEAPTNN